MRKVGAIILKRKDQHLGCGKKMEKKEKFDLKKIIKMVQYPTKKETVELAMLVLVTMLGVSGVIFGIDSLILKIYSAVI